MGYSCGVRSKRWNRIMHSGPRLSTSAMDYGTTRAYVHSMVNSESGKWFMLKSIRSVCISLIAILVSDSKSHPASYYSFLQLSDPFLEEAAEWVFDIFSEGWNVLKAHFLIQADGLFLVNACL